MLMKCWQTQYSISLVSKMSTESFIIEVQDLEFEVNKKDIKNLLLCHLKILVETISNKEVQTFQLLIVMSLIIIIESLL